MKKYHYFWCYPEKVNSLLNDAAEKGWTLVSLRRKTSTDLMDIVMERDVDEPVES